MNKSLMYTVLTIAAISILFLQRDKKGRSKLLKKIEDSAKGALEDTLSKLDSGEIDLQTAKTV